MFQTGVRRYSRYIPLAMSKFLASCARWQHETQWQRCSATFWQGDNSHCGKGLRRVLKSPKVKVKVKVKDKVEVEVKQSQSQRPSRS